MIAEHLPQLFLAWSIQWVGILAPGPSVALILAVATTRGRPASIVTCFGIGCGSVVLAIATVFGLTALLAQVAWALTAMKILGAAYLAWLAWKAFRSAAAPEPLNLDASVEGSVWRTALAGFLLQATNPKAIMFWLAVASVGGVGGAPLPIVALFVLGAFVNSFVGHGAYALLLSSRPFRSGYMRARRAINLGLGGFFLFASARLALART